MYSKNPGKSAVGLHCLTFAHDPQKLSSSLLLSCWKGRQLDRLEEIEVIKAYNKDRYHSINDLNATYVKPIVRFLLD